MSKDEKHQSKKLLDFITTTCIKPGLELRNILTSEATNLEAWMTTPRFAELAPAVHSAFYADTALRSKYPEIIRKAEHGLTIAEEVRAEEVAGIMSDFSDKIKRMLSYENGKATFVTPDEKTTLAAAQDIVKSSFLDTKTKLQAAYEATVELKRKLQKTQVLASAASRGNRGGGGGGAQAQGGGGEGAGRRNRGGRGKGAQDGGNPEPADGEAGPAEGQPAVSAFDPAGRSPPQGGGKGAKGK